MKMEPVVADATHRFLPQPAGVRSDGGISPAWCVVLVLLTCVPLLYPVVPPLTDLPAHMSRYMVQVDGGRSADLARWYSVRWTIIPNLGVDLLAQMLVPRLGLEPAVKVIAILIVALQASGYLALARAAHGRVPGSALFALPLAYSSPFLYGFVNFSLAIALSTLALALWISPWMAARTRWRWPMFVAIGAIVWVSHLAGWAVLCLAIGTCELVTRYQRSRQFWPALIGGFVGCTCLLVPQVASMLIVDAPERLPTGGFLMLPYKFFHLLHVLADRWDWFDWLSSGALVVLLMRVRHSPVFGFDPRLISAAGVLLLSFVATPSWVFGSFFADMRQLPSMLALAILAVRPHASATAAQRQVMTILGLAFFLVRIGGTTASLALWDRDIRAQLKVLDALPTGSQLVTFNARPCQDIVLFRDRAAHLASYALMRRRAFANDQFELSGGQIVRVHNPALAPFEHDPSASEFGEKCQSTGIPVLESAARIPPAARHLWILWTVPELPIPGWRVAARAGGSVLYTRTVPAPKLHQPAAPERIR